MLILDVFDRVLYFYSMDDNTPDKKVKLSLNEPSVEYEKTSIKKGIKFFGSFEEAEDNGRRQMAEHTPEQRLLNLDILRKRIYSEYLLPNGEFPGSNRSFKVIKASWL
ncbi:MAG: hypothetical protein JWO06_2767 [Bacteroidota bacterium]|nr:hypothetical protein [Bacteroidota bacterium]